MSLTDFTALSKENVILRETVTILDRRLKEMKESFKQLELKLTLEFTEKERQFATKIESLERQSKIQTMSMRSLNLDALSQQSSQNAALSDENSKSQKRIKSLRKQLCHRDSVIKDLNSRISELETAHNQITTLMINQHKDSQMQLTVMTTELEKFTSVDRSPAVDKMERSHFIKSITATPTTGAPITQYSSLSKQTTGSTKHSLNPKIYDICAIQLQRTDEVCLLLFACFRMSAEQTGKTNYLRLTSNGLKTRIFHPLLPQKAVRRLYCLKICSLA